MLFGQFSEWIILQYLSIHFLFLQIYFHKIPDEVIDSLVYASFNFSTLYLISLFFHWTCPLHLSTAHPSLEHMKVSLFDIFQIEEGDVLYVAGGLMVEHPLTSPFVEAIVSISYNFCR